MTDFAMEYRPTLAERMWRRLGFRYHLGEEPPDTDAMAGWMKTDVHLHLDWADRLRLLLTGHIFVGVVTHTDTPSASVCKTRTDWRIYEPGARRT